MNIIYAGTYFVLIIGFLKNLKERIAAVGGFNGRHIGIHYRSGEIFDREPADWFRAQISRADNFSEGPRMVLLPHRRDRLVRGRFQQFRRRRFDMAPLHHVPGQSAGRRDVRFGPGIDLIPGKGDPGNPFRATSAASWAKTSVSSMLTMMLSRETPRFSENSAMEWAQRTAMPSVIFRARTSNAPFRMPGKQIELFTWLGKSPGPWRRGSLGVVVPYRNIAGFP
jgi:hypothetical protein